MLVWDKLSKPPASALKEIKAGRLRGMSDINPQWRYKALTEQFGMCGVGWKFEIVKLWTEPGDNGQVFAFAQINLFINKDSENVNWSDPIPGVGGSMLITMESKGLHANDEAYKMAITDALSTACKMIGVASAIYEGNWDGSKYKDDATNKHDSEIDPHVKPTLTDIKFKAMKDAILKGEYLQVKSRMNNYQLTTEQEATLNELISGVENG